MYKKHILFILTTLLLSVSFSQVNVNSAQYEQQKKNGTLDPLQVIYAPRVVTPTISVDDGARSGNCDCYTPVDTSFILDGPLSNTDDGNSLLVNLPFTFCFYGTNYNQAYINANGNISFGAPYSTFTANPFPDPSFIMVAPFWGDVDTRGTGNIYYKVTNNALIVSWEAVGYYDSYTDKVNTFQVKITDGSDLSIGTGNNVAFCYKDMQWTTGDASGGINGFFGTPATVGANKGDGINYIQFGQFDRPGSNYDGPFGVTDGVDYLDNKSFKFSTCVTTNNIPPIPLSVNNCDTVTVCVGQTFDIEFVAPENGQNTYVSVNTTNAPNFMVTQIDTGLIGRLTGNFFGNFNNVGLNTLQITASDDGTPPASTTIDVTFNVIGAFPDFDMDPDNWRNWENEVNNFFDRSIVSPGDSITGWNWDFGDGSPTSSSKNSSHVYADSGFYGVTLTITTKEGCVVSVSKPLTILPMVFPPNVISPNDDDKNDAFYIAGLHFFANTNLSIYNRWGSLVYESFDYKNDWKGLDKNGNQLADGVYYYVLQNHEWIEKLTGSVNLFRE